MGKKLLFTFTVLAFISQYDCFSQHSATATDTSFQNVVIKDDFRADTVRAIKHMFERKRKGGRTRAIVFGLLCTIALVNEITYQPDYVVINQGSAGTQRMDVVSSPDPAGYIFIAFSGVMTVTGITQHAKYNAANLRAVLHEYEQGILPAEIKLKLKNKDFR